MLLDTVVGVVAFLLTAVSLIKSPDDQGFVAVSIWNGNDGDGLEGSAGGFPWISIKGTGGEDLGRDMDQNRKLKNSAQVTVNVKVVDNIEVGTVRLSMHNTDAICAAMISWAPSSNMPNAEHRAGFVVGDLFYFCGKAWNHSRQQHYLKDKKEWVNLKCGWLDADNTAPKSTKFVTINTDIMSTTNLGHFDAAKNDICYWGFATATNAAYSPMKRASEHLAKFGNQVHVSKDLSAVELCDSETSWGSSFYSIDEKIFCDMSTKTKIPLCENGNVAGCFNYISPRNSHSLGYSNQRRGSIRTPSGIRNFNVSYFTITDLNGNIVDDGNGY
ncbi:hypothetical protein BGZ96_003233 [Linnemannia gamsii]|uniref:Uncharacterized protein n=1 Tax=Linnemannia gamsii TaxID=64522 RepID=A0ABQ7JJN8_9FUNG|nr:hypothetical protein BGZ96_003233 [Linnemannia gamsii]